jgi:hypothetical protein
MTLFSDNQTSGIALKAYTYHPSDRTSTVDVAGTATASLTHNVVYMGVDWRHFARTSTFKGVEGVVRGIVDFFDENGGTVVPVELVSFDAKARTSDVDVFWATASEQNADHFRVERSDVTAGVTSTDDYATVATVAASGTTTDRRDYAVVDRNVAPGTYLYRLVMADRDGSQSRTPAVQVVIGQEQAAVITSVTPNPVVNESRVVLSLQQPAMTTVTVVDINGRTVATIHDGDLSAGTHELTLDASALANGAYTIVVNADGASTSSTIRVVR